MSDIKLFRLQAGKAVELQGDASDLEKPLQTLIEANLDTLLGIRFLATEYSTGNTHAGLAFVEPQFSSNSVQACAKEKGAA